MSKPFILYSKMAHVTGKRIRDALGIDGGRKLSSVGDYTHLIRWGASYAPDLDAALENSGRHVLNPAERIKRVVNRHHMFNEISRRTNRTLNYTGGMRWVGHDGSTAVARHRFSKWGRDIVDQPDLTEINPDDPKWDGYFLVERWLADYEVRVHIVNGVSASFQIKVKKDDNDDPLFRLEPESADFTVRNDKNGWYLFPLSASRADQLGINKTPIRDAAKMMMSGLGLDFGCVDFLVRVPNGHHADSFQWKFLEVNTAPGLDGTTLDRYVDHLGSATNLNDEEPESEESEDSQAQQETQSPPRTSQEEPFGSRRRRAVRVAERSASYNRMQIREMQAAMDSCDCLSCRQGQNLIDDVLSNESDEETEEPEDNEEENTSTEQSRFVMGYTSTSNNITF